MSLADAEAILRDRSCEEHEKIVARDLLDLHEAVKTYFLVPTNMGYARLQALVDRLEGKP